MPETSVWAPCLYHVRYSRLSLAWTCGGCTLVTLRKIQSNFWSLLKCNWMVRNEEEKGAAFWTEQSCCSGKRKVRPRMEWDMHTGKHWQDILKEPCEMNGEWNYKMNHKQNKFTWSWTKPWKLTHYLYLVWRFYCAFRIKRSLKGLYISWNTSAELLMVMLRVEDIAYQSLNNVLIFTYKQEP